MNRKIIRRFAGLATLFAFAAIPATIISTLFILFPGGMIFALKVIGFALGVFSIAITLAYIDFIWAALVDAWKWAFKAIKGL